MDKGKMVFINKWGYWHFIYAYMMLKIKQLLGLRFSIVYSKELDHSNVKSFYDNGYTFRPVKEEDFEKIPDLLALDLTQAFLDKVKLRKDKCAGAFFQEKLIGYTWSTTEAVEINNGVYLSFNDNCYYGYKNFVLPEHRGKGIIQKIKKISINSKEGDNRTKTFSCIESHNYPSLNASKKEGNKKQGFSLFIDNKIGFYSWSSPRAKQIGVKVYKNYN